MGRGGEKVAVGEVVRMGMERETKKKIWVEVQGNTMGIA